MSHNISLRHECPDGHEECGTNGRRCGNCADKYMQDLESPPKAFAFGGLPDTKFGLFQQFQPKKTSSDCGGGRAVSETLASIPKWVIEETTWPPICKTFMCNDGKLVDLHNDGTSYVHKTVKFLGKLTEPTIFVDPETKSFVEVVPVQQVAPVPQRLAAPVQQVAPVPQRLAAPVQQVAPVPQRLAAPVAKAQSRSQITVDDIRDGADRWFCEGTLYSGRIERDIYQQHAYIFENEYFLRLEDLVYSINFCESLNQ